MTKEEMMEKLKQIEEQARMTLNELPLRLVKDRLKLIIGLAKYMRTGIIIEESRRNENRFDSMSDTDTRQ